MPKTLPSSAPTGPRGARGRRVSTTLSEINVIPLVDVMLVLLIIFMVAAPMLQRGVEVTLPEARQSREISGERLFVDVPLSYRENRRVHLAKEEVRIEVLAERIRQALINKADKQVFVRSDGKLEVQVLIDVLDALKAGGAETAGIVTDPPKNAMNEPTSAVLMERARLEPGARHNLAWSVAGRTSSSASPSSPGRAPRADPSMRQVMTISLSGSPGPNTGGMTQMGGAAAAPVRPAASGTAATAGHAHAGGPAIGAVKPPARTEAQPSRRAPAAPEPTTGNTPVVTGARGQGFGLSSSGGSVGRSVEMDVSNFCCPEYIERVVLVIQRNWDKRARCARRIGRHLHHPSRRYGGRCGCETIEWLLRARQRGDAGDRARAAVAGACRRSSPIRRSRFTSPSSTSSHDAHTHASSLGPAASGSSSSACCSWARDSGCAPSCPAPQQPQRRRAAADRARRRDRRRQRRAAALRGA